MKGLILAAGRGTRMLPLTKDTPKPLIKLNGKPMIDYIIDHLVGAGIYYIGIVINSQYEDHFKRALSHHRVANIYYIHQDDPKGISHAIACSENFIGDEDFICVLGDNYIRANKLIGDMKRELEYGFDDAVLAVKFVGNPEEFGIVKLEHGKIVGIEEKPKNSKSNIAAMGIYAFNSKIFRAIKLISPSERGELEITDAIQVLLANGCSIGHCLALRVDDIGTIERLKLAELSE